MRQYPIWHAITACNYKSSKSYGSLNTAETVVNIGSSRSNSHELVKHVTTRREEGDYIVFRFGVDLLDGNGLQVLKTTYMHAKTKEVTTDVPAELAA